jgi:predicted short-subunit dehydrogenase-like oxidoreductase (DUF2520 family)
VTRGQPLQITGYDRLARRLDRRPEALIVHVDRLSLDYLRSMGCPARQEAALTAPTARGEMLAMRASTAAAATSFMRRWQAYRACTR